MFKATAHYVSLEICPKEKIKSRVSSFGHQTCHLNCYAPNFKEVEGRGDIGLGSTVRLSIELNARNPTLTQEP